MGRPGLGTLLRSAVVSVTLERALYRLLTVRAFCVGGVFLYWLNRRVSMSLNRKPPEGDVRRVRSMGQNLPGVTTNKNGRTVQFESFAERILLVLFERDKT